MPISIGSNNVKPYVGDKEVKEAYVGSTLVYSTGPVNPVIFKKNEINYRYSGTNFTVTSEGFKMTGASELIFTGLDLSNFVKIVVNAHTGSSNEYLTVNFIDASGNVSANIRKTFDKNSLSYKQYDIPAEYKNPRTKIKFSTTNARNLELLSAILS